MIPVLLFLVLLFTSSHSQTKAETSEHDIRQALYRFNHDNPGSKKNIPLALNGSSLDVILQFEVIDVRNIDEITNTFVVDMLIYFTWYVLHVFLPTLNATTLVFCLNRAQ